MVANSAFPTFVLHAYIYFVACNGALNYIESNLNADLGFNELPLSLYFVLFWKKPYNQLFSNIYVCYNLLKRPRIFISFASYCKCVHANLRQKFFEEREGLSISIKYDESFFVFGLTRSWKAFTSTFLFVEVKIYHRWYIKLWKLLTHPCT